VVVAAYLDKMIKEEASCDYFGSNNQKNIAWFAQYLPADAWLA
jgi:hypothetical protein